MLSDYLFIYLLNNVHSAWDMVMANPVLWLSQWALPPQPNRGWAFFSWSHRFYVFLIFSLLFHGYSFPKGSTGAHGFNKVSFSLWARKSLYFLGQKLWSVLHSVAVYFVNLLSYTIWEFSKCLKQRDMNAVPIALGDFGPVHHPWVSTLPLWPCEISSLWWLQCLLAPCPAQIPRHGFGSGFCGFQEGKENSRSAHVSEICLSKEPGPQFCF